MSHVIASKLFVGCPKFFEDFQTAFCSSEAGHIAAKFLKLRICQNVGSEYYIDDLVHVARQWRLAESFESIVAKDISSDLKRRNSAFLKNQLSVAALEKFAKLFGESWYDGSFSVFRCADITFADDLRNVVRDTPAKKIRNSLNNKLLEKWDKFIDGDNSQLCAIAVSLRHAFAHGEIWGAKQLEPHALELSRCILGKIRTDIKMHTSSVS